MFIKSARSGDIFTWRGVEKKEPSYIAGGNVIVYSHYREQYGGSLKTLPKSYMHPNVHCSTVYNSQDMELAKMSISRAMDKEDVVYTYNRILLSH